MNNKLMEIAEEIKEDVYIIGPKKVTIDYKNSELRIKFDGEPFVRYSLTIAEYEIVKTGLIEVLN